MQACAIVGYSAVAGIPLIMQPICQECIPLGHLLYLAIASAVSCLFQVRRRRAAGPLTFLHPCLDNAQGTLS